MPEHQGDGAIMTANDKLPDNLFYGGFYNSGPDKPDHEEIRICSAWIEKYCEPRKTFNKNCGSYNLKHRVENWDRAVNVPYRGYISNGSLIAAFILLGYGYKQTDPGSQNAYFKFKYIGPKVGDRYYKQMPYNTEEWKAVRELVQ